MKKVTMIAGIVMLVFGSSCSNTESKVPESQKGTPGNTVAASDTTSLKKGQYLVQIMACADCHSPKKFTPEGPVPDMDRFLSGYNSAQPLPKFDVNLMQKEHVVMFNGESTAFAGPWGVSFAANLTPDETGIGNWTYDQFKTALTKGKFKGLDNARNLLPPMPWPNYKNMPDEDIKAIFLYLKSLKPVHNLVPDAIAPTTAKR